MTEHEPMTVRKRSWFWLTGVMLVPICGGAANALAQEQEMVRPVLEVDRLRASASLQNALDGRALAGRYLCGDESRLRRINDLDDLLAPLLVRYQQRFGSPWSAGDTLPDRTQAMEQITGRRDDCVRQDSFYAGLADYQNGLYATRSVLGSSDEDYRRPRAGD